MSDSCPDCSAFYIDRVLQRGEELVCMRCGKRLKKYCDLRSLQGLWALVTAALVCFVMANMTPIMVFDVAGNTQSNLIITGVTRLYSQGYWPLAGLVFFSAIALPALHLSAFWYLLGGCCLNKSWRGLSTALAIVDQFSSWNLIPVFAVATIAAVVKLDQLGSVEWESGAWWMTFLSLFSLAAMRAFDRKVLSEILQVETGISSHELTNALIQDALQEK